MNRIEARFSELKEQKKKGLVVYIGAGDPHLEATERLALSFDKAGVDILELGIPFSDPLADGIVNQLAAQRGLASGTTPVGVLNTVRSIREKSQIPIVFFVYYNLIHQYGLERFVTDAAASGVDGLLVLDLPPEEGALYHEEMTKGGLLPIYLIAPTTPEDRVELIASQAAGFIYYVSREGVTGMQSEIADSIGPMTAKIRQHTDLPIAIGFGISNPEQATKVASFGDACVVGSAVVKRIGEQGDSDSLVETVGGFVRELNEALKAI
jgi:tryptophan synthase alpha chain